MEKAAQHNKIAVRNGPIDRAAHSETTNPEPKMHTSYGHCPTFSLRMREVHPNRTSDTLRKWPNSTAANGMAITQVLPKLALPSPLDLRDPSGSVTFNTYLVLQPVAGQASGGNHTIRNYYPRYVLLLTASNRPALRPTTPRPCSKYR